MSLYTNRKKSMSWLDLKVWLKEQNINIINSYIDSVNYVSKSPILLIKLYNSIKSSKFWLIIEPSKRMSILFSNLSLSEYSEASQKMWKLLLKDCQIIDVYQIPCERIVYIHMNCRHELRKIVAEFLPRGVVCILNENNKILLCNEYKHMKDRELKPGLNYIPPPSQQQCIDVIDVIRRSAKINNLDITRVLIREAGIPPEVAESITIQCDNKNKMVKDLMESDILCIASAYKNLIDSIENKIQACIVYDENGAAIGFYPYTPVQFVSHRNEIFSTFNEAINKYYENELKENILNTYSYELRKKIESMSKALIRIDDTIQDLEKQLDEFLRKIKIIEENYIYFEHLHECVLDKVKTVGWKEISLCGSIHDFSPSLGVYRVKYENIVLEFDVRKNFIDNYNDLRRTVANIEKAIKKTKKEKNDIINKLRELQEQVKYKEKKISYRLKKVKEWYESYIWYITSNGFLVIGGKDASQNIKIIKRLTEANDIVLHANIHGASTVVIKTREKIVNENDVKEAALIAACYSKAWKLKIMNIDVFWVYGSQVSLSPPSGEYLPKGSYMVYGEKNYIKNIELKLAIGIELLNNDSIRIFVGPEEVVEKRAIAYFVIIPGDEDSKSIVQNFINFLKSRKLDDLASIIDADDIAEKIPGRSKIIKLVAKNLEM